MINILDKADCCGCSACVEVCPKSCISFDEDLEGFRYPKVNEEVCISCGLCEKVCPMLHTGETRIPLLTYAAKNNDLDCRFKSTSGGIFTLLAEKTISEGGVVYGAKYDESFEVVHGCVDSVESIGSVRGSKYIQSRTEDCFMLIKQQLNQNKRVLFSGTPCQVKGLKNYLRRDYENLLTVDFVCHGVNSPKVWRMYLSDIVRRYSMESDFPSKKSIKDMVKNVNFRSKVTGWKTSILEIEMQRKENEGYSDYKYFSGQEVYMISFDRNLFIRPSCYNCKFKNGKSDSDITLGDFWGIEKIMPDFNDVKGVSLLMVNSQKGKEYIKNLNADLRPVTYEEGRRYNGGFKEKILVHPHRATFFNKLNSCDSVIDLMWQSLHYSIPERIVRKIKRTIFKQELPL